MEFMRSEDTFRGLSPPQKPGWEARAMKRSTPHTPQRPGPLPFMRPLQKTLLKALLTFSLTLLASPLLLACGSKTIESHPDQLVGVGLILKTSPQGAVVDQVINSGPADHAGLRKGDRVLSVDGEYVGNRSLAAVVDLLRGTEGSKVLIGVENLSGRVEVLVTRAPLSRGNGGYTAR